MIKRAYIYCEGQTEESFVNHVLYPYFLNVGIYVFPIICSTSRTATKKYKGGATDYNKIKYELQNLCKQDKNCLVTTMFDYYAMPTNTPEIGYQETDLYQRMQHIEDAIEQDIGQSNCKFNFMVHEFEGLLFSEPTAFLAIADQHVVDALQAMREEAQTPEHINNSVETAPSKRLERVIPRYAKVKNGAIVSQKIGIDTMLRECHHFARWIDRIKTYYA